MGVRGLSTFVSITFVRRCCVTVRPHVPHRSSMRISVRPYGVTVVRRYLPAAIPLQRRHGRIVHPRVRYSGENMRVRRDDTNLIYLLYDYNTVNPGFAVLSSVCVCDPLGRDWPRVACKCVLNAVVVVYVFYFFFFNTTKQHLKYGR